MQKEFYIINNKLIFGKGISQIKIDGNMDYHKLAEAAVKAKEKSRSPYSKFRVGAALLSKSGDVTDGANIENASFSLTVCAERTAVFRAYMEEKKEFDAIAIAADAEDFVPPCGACREVLRELCGGELDVVLVNKANEIKVYKLKELLPLNFTL